MCPCFSVLVKWAATCGSGAASRLIWTIFFKPVHSPYRPYCKHISVCKHYLIIWWLCFSGQIFWHPSLVSDFCLLVGWPCYYGDVFSQLYQWAWTIGRFVSTNVANSQSSFQSVSTQWVSCLSPSHVSAVWLVFSNRSEFCDDCVIRVPTFSCICCLVSLFK
jgi:hypothetical protein